MVFASLPFLQRRKLLRDGVEQTDNDFHRYGFHLIAELADFIFILREVSTYM